LGGGVLDDFATARGGEWLENIAEYKWRVRSDKLMKLGPRFTGIEVIITFDKNFGSRITAIRRSVATIEEGVRGPEQPSAPVRAR
jgi:hypothetical protein